MAPTAEEDLAALRIASQELNSLSDAATACIRRLDKALEEIGPGVTVWAGQIAEEPCEVPYCTGHSEETTIVPLSKVVGYTKIPNKGWRLAIECYHPEVDQEGNPSSEDFKTQSIIALEVAPREDRLAALAELPRVIEMLRGTVERKITTVKGSMATAGKILFELETALNKTNAQKK